MTIETTVDACGGACYTGMGRVLSLAVPFPYPFNTTRLTKPEGSVKVAKATKKSRKSVKPVSESWKKRLATCREQYGDKYLQKALKLSSNRNIRLWISGKRRPTKEHESVINRLYNRLRRVVSSILLSQGYGTAGISRDSLDFLIGTLSIIRQPFETRLKNGKTRLNKEGYISELNRQIASQIRQVVSSSTGMVWEERTSISLNPDTQLHSLIRQKGFEVVTDMSANDAVLLREAVWVLSAAFQSIEDKKNMKKHFQKYLDMSYIYNSKKPKPWISSKRSRTALEYWQSLTADIIDSEEG